jgi:hypothetical protein
MRNSPLPARQEQSPRPQYIRATASPKRPIGIDDEELNPPKRLARGLGSSPRHHLPPHPSPPCIHLRRDTPQPRRHGLPASRHPATRLHFLEGQDRRSVSQLRSSRTRQAAFWRIPSAHQPLRSTRLCVIGI